MDDGTRDYLTDVHKSVFLDWTQQHTSDLYSVAERRYDSWMRAVKAQIWDEGYAAAEWNAEEVCKCAAWNEDECGCGNYGNGHRIKRNPYKEAA